MGSRVYTILLVIAGFIIAAFVMIATGNFVIKTEPADDSSNNSKLTEQKKIVYVYDTPELESEQLARNLAE